MSAATDATVRESSVLPARTPVELQAYTPVAEGDPGPEARAAYLRDGVVCLRRAFSPRWVDLVAEGMERAMHDAAGRGTAFNVAAPGEPGYFFYDSFMWKHMEAFRSFVFESPGADLSRRAMGSESATLYFDFMLVKEPGTSRATPWHYDEAFWPISGDQACNLWLALDDIPLATALRFLRGSHRRADHYRSVHFDPDLSYADPPNLPPPPDWNVESGDHEIVYAPLEPGDCVVFHNRTHHSAPGNSLESTRRRALSTLWFGDDVRYNDKPQECDPPYRGENLVHGGSMECETFPRVR